MVNYSSPARNDIIFPKNFIFYIKIEFTCINLRIEGKSLNKFICRIQVKESIIYPFFSIWPFSMIILGDTQKKIWLKISAFKIFYGISSKLRYLCELFYIFSCRVNLGFNIVSEYLQSWNLLHKLFSSIIFNFYNFQFIIEWFFIILWNHIKGHKGK
jgi:hypothetical protein